MKNKHEFIEEIATEHLSSFLITTQFNSIIINTRELISTLQEKGMRQILCPESLVSFQGIGVLQSLNGSHAWDQKVP